MAHSKEKNSIKGKKFGALTPVAKLGKTSYGKIQWKCLCDCGKHTKAVENHLKSGARVSCGCRIHRKKYLLTIEELCAQDKLAQYRKGARQRGYTFNLDKDYFMDMIFKECHYCGEVGSNTFNLKSSKNRQTYETTVNYNGLDRIDNNKGYEKDNCVTCCKYCNIMKMDLTQEDFFSKIKMIYEKSAKEAEERKEAGTLRRNK